VNEDQLYDAAERGIGLYVNEAARISAERDAAKAALARVLSWFPTSRTRNEASATRAQLAHAYKDGQLEVPGELRKFLSAAPARAAKGHDDKEIGHDN